MIGFPYNPNVCIFIANQTLNADQFNDNVPNAGNTTTHNLLWDTSSNSMIWVDTKTNLIVYEITGGGTLPNNPYDFYLDGTVAVGGNGSVESPFKTITELNNAVLALPANANVYTAIVLPDPAGYGNEVIGTLNIAENLNLFGINASNTTINCPILLTSTGLGFGGNVLTYRNVAFNNIFTLDLTLSTFAFVSFIDGQFNVQRIDNNPNANVSITGGVLTSFILGGAVTMVNTLIFGDINVGPGATLFAVNTRLYGGTFKLTGNSTLKTLSTLNPIAGYVDGTVDGSGTPTWITDEASNEAYTGTVNKIILGNDFQLGGLAVLDAAGQIVIPNPNVSATTRFLLTAQDGGAAPTGSIYQSSRINGVSFTIQSTAGVADAGVEVYYQLYGS
jgi:hypothetical protein